MSFAHNTDVQDYLAKRSALIQDERSLRRDYACHAFLEPCEIQADKIIRAVRSEEAENVWNSSNSTLRDMFPGMQFLTAKDVISTTRLFNIIKKMPKGALLHAHIGAMLDIEILLTMALEQPAMHVSVAQSLSPETLFSIAPRFRAINLSSPPNNIRNSLADPSYKPGDLVPLRQARENFDSALGGPKGFDRWVYAIMTINPSEAYEKYTTTEKIWEKFEVTHDISAGLTRYYPLWYPYLKTFFLSSVDDGISYIEARILFWFQYMFGPDGEENIPHREWLVNFDRAVKSVKEELEARERGNEFVGAKVIYTTMRNVTCDEMEAFCEDCIQLKLEFSHLIAGFDLVGFEDGMRPLVEYIGPFLKFQQHQKELGINIPFLFHAAETLGDGTPTDMSLYDAVLLDTKRIGHGFTLFRHPKLMEICREKGIAVQMCPISNEILRLTSSMPMHPLPATLNHGIPIALCSDDPAIFGNMGLSYDFFQVIVSSEVTGLNTLGQFARDSLEYSMLEDDDKAKAIALWESRWKQFCKEVVREIETMV